MDEININAGNVSSIGLRTQISNVTAPSSGVRIFDKASGIYFVDVSGTVSGPIGAFFSPGGRISMVSGTAVTTTDIYSGTSLWYNPYQHDMLPLWDGNKVVPVQFSPTQISLSGLSGTSCFDLFTYLNGSSAAFETVMWTSPTVRSTDISVQNGRYCKVGDATRLYLGSFYTSSAGKTSDGIRNRFVWNYYNRLNRRLYKAEGTQHTYATTSIRAWNNDTTQIVEIICGAIEEPIKLSMRSYSWTGVGWVGIGYDTVDNIISGINYPINSRNATDTGEAWSQSFEITHYPTTVGYHYYSSIEKADSGTLTLDHYFIDASIKG